MQPITVCIRVGQLLATTLLCVGAVSSVSAQANNVQRPRDAFVRYAKSHAIPLEAVTPEAEFADLRPVAALIGSARVVALGEPAHGAHEPLAFRNRLFRYLVEELGFTAIALESALPESRRILDFVAGGADDPRAVVRENFSWGLGAFHENERLVRWVRDYNADAANRRKIRIYGIDLSLAGPAASTPTPAAVNEVLSYLDRVDTAAARRIRTTLLHQLNRLADPALTLSPTEHAQLSAGVDDLIALLERQRPAFSAATSTAEWEWAHRNAIVAQQANRVFRLLPPPEPGGAIPPMAWQTVSARDSAMAENSGGSWIRKARPVGCSSSHITSTSRTRQQREESGARSHGRRTRWGNISA